MVKVYGWSCRLVCGEVNCSAESVCWALRAARETLTAGVSPDSRMQISTTNMLNEVVLFKTKHQLQSIVIGIIFVLFTRQIIYLSSPDRLF